MIQLNQDVIIYSNIIENMKAKEKYQKYNNLSAETDAATRRILGLLSYRQIESDIESSLDWWHLQ